jgi:hypothetical protein
MAGLVPAIHVLGRLQRRRTWMPGTRPGMTVELIAPSPVNSREKANNLRILAEHPYIHDRLALPPT